MTNLVLPPAPVFVLVGPPRVGKKTMISLAQEIFPMLVIGKSFTTSQQQADDRPDRYVFSNREAIIDALAGGEVLEWSQSGGDIYASCRPDPTKPTILVMDTTGAARIIAYHIASLPVIFIGVVPMVRYEDDDRRSAAEKQRYHQQHPRTFEAARLEVLRTHLRARGQVSPEEADALMLVAHAEMTEILTFWPNRADTHIIENVDGRREEGVAQLARIIRDKIDAWRDACDNERNRYIAELESESSKKVPATKAPAESRRGSKAPALRRPPQAQSVKPKKTPVKKAPAKRKTR